MRAVQGTTRLKKIALGSLRAFENATPPCADRLSIFVQKREWPASLNPPSLCVQSSSQKGLRSHYSASTQLPDTVLYCQLVPPEPLPFTLHCPCSTSDRMMWWYCNRIDYLAAGKENHRGAPLFSMFNNESLAAMGASFAARVTAEGPAAMLLSRNRWQVWKRHEQYQRFPRSNLPFTRSVKYRLIPCGCCIAPPCMLPTNPNALHHGESIHVFKDPNIA